MISTLHICFILDPKKPTHPPTPMRIYISQNKCKQCKQSLQSTLHSTIYNICLPWLNIESQYPYDFVHNFKPMDWLQLHCGRCHMMDWCDTRNSHGKTMISPPGNLAFSCVSVSNGRMARSSILGLRVLTCKIVF